MAKEGQAHCMAKLVIKKAWGLFWEMVGQRDCASTPKRRVKNRMAPSGENVWAMFPSMKRSIFKALVSRRVKQGRRRTRTAYCILSCELCWAEERAVLDLSTRLQVLLSMNGRCRGHSGWSCASEWNAIITLQAQQRGTSVLENNNLGVSERFGAVVNT